MNRRYPFPLKSGAIRRGGPYYQEILKAMSQGKRSGNSSKSTEKTSKKPPEKTSKKLPEKPKKNKQNTKTSSDKSTTRYNKSENECRRVLQNIFIGYKFPNVRPDFMENNKTKRCLELDCYNEKLNLALEYNGKQHYKYVPIFHKGDKDAYKSQKERDEQKKKICTLRNITLIVVPYTVPFKDIERYIVDNVKEFIAKKYIREEIKLKDINLSHYPEIKEYIKNYLESKMKKIKRY